MNREALAELQTVENAPPRKRCLWVVRLERWPNEPFLHDEIPCDEPAEVTVGPGLHTCREHGGDALACVLSGRSRLEGVPRVPRPEKAGTPA